MRRNLSIDSGVLNPTVQPRPSAVDGRRTGPRGGLPSDARRSAVLRLARLDTDGVLEHLGSTPDGLTEAQVRENRARFGANVVASDKPRPAIVQFALAFANPFNGILMFLVAIMLGTDVIFADPADGPDWTGVLTVTTMVLVSASLRFWQEYRSTRAADALRAMVTTTAQVVRTHHGVPVTSEIPVTDLVRGDVVHLAAGDMFPADVRLIRAKDLQVNQAMLTGESLPVEKTAHDPHPTEEAAVFDATTLGFLGTSVVSGSGTAVVIGTGQDTVFGALSHSLTGARPETAFDTGIRRVSYTLIRFMLVMVPVVFVVNGLTKDWGTAFLFAVTTAVGLTPEMLPLIVTANLARGARFMADRKVIVKRLNSIQNLGAMDVLATDKTGTLTEDRIVLARHVDTSGRSSTSVLRHAAANSVFQTGLRNLLDEAVASAAGPATLDGIRREWTLVDEVPFDFDRRRMSVIVAAEGGHLLIAKGAVEEMLEACVDEVGPDGTRAMTPGRRAELEGMVAEQNDEGLRVLAVAVRRFDADREEYGRDDERGLTLIGFLAFLDPPKATAAAAIASLRSHGTEVTVITGDNALVAAAVCREVGIDPGTVVLGSETDGLSLHDLGELAESTRVFAKVDPAQKARIVEAMRANGHTVGYLGDGINDAAALRAADVGISVDTAVDIAKESADIILLDKDLTVLEGGVLAGRRTFVNAMKYIKMTASSNFGNMFSVLVASALLPFIPMIPLVVLVQNLAYDLSMLTLPWDRVDDEDIARPRRWDATRLGPFMMRIGPISSIFDLTTFAVMWFVFQASTPADASLFQSGWFVESIISQTLIVHMLRTGSVPFVKSRPSLPVLLATGAVCAFGLVLPFSGWGHDLGLVSLPWTYFPWLIATLAVYCLLVQVCKRAFVRRFGAWI